MNKCDLMLYLGIHRFRVPLLEIALPVNSEEGDQKHLNHFTRRLIVNGGGGGGEDYI